MSIGVIVEFKELAEEYCQFITDKEIPIASVSYLIEILMKLYISVMNLPK